MGHLSRGLIFAIVATAACLGCQPAYLPGDPWLAYDPDPAGWFGGASDVPMGALPSTYQNPALFHGAQPDVLWDHVSDVVDDYFRIKREQRVSWVGNVMVEGQIETYPKTGASIFEPWHRDSVGMDERWESTLQSIRRQCFVRVIPTGDGYLVDVRVEKELEDVPRPEHATSSGAVLRRVPSASLDAEGLDRTPPTVGWIPQGRDRAIEQRILQCIYQRSTG